MLKKNKRILWLLNHKTLMAYEVALMMELGFEVFTPKIIPQSVGFRSAAVDFSFDASLTVPKTVLDRLNCFNFYEEVWPADIVALINRYFGTVFVMPYGVQIPEALDKFEGQVVFRAFGLANTDTYCGVLSLMYGREILKRIELLGDRFWFGEGYEQLHECELPVLSQRSIFLPIGVPSSFWKAENSWTGTEKKILFVCPNCVTNPYYAEVYAKFKSEFGGLPHIIVGAQDVPVDDPHFAGFVSDAELARLYRECTVLYYHSTELRHVHYSPIEAAINGMPVVYYRDSLLGRLTDDDNAGCVNTYAEARQVIEQMLGEDDSLSVQISREQRSLAFKFSDAYCKKEWLKNMEGGGFAHALKSERRRNIYKREVWRTLIKPLAGGLAQLPKTERAMTAQQWAMLNAKDGLGASTGIDEIDFVGDQLPSFVRDIKGLSFCESWGRWSDGEEIVVKLNYLLEKNVRIVISGVVYGDNVGEPVYISVGSSKRVMTFSAGSAEENTITVDFTLRRPSNIIRIKVPRPTTLEGGGRSIGIGLVKMGVELLGASTIRRKDRLITATEWAASAAAEEGDSVLTFESGIDFTSENYPPFVQSIKGLSFCESWGRWSDGEEIVIKLSYVLENNFRIVISGVAYGDNIGKPVHISVGSTKRVMTFSAGTAEENTITVDFNLRRPSNIIRIKVPRSTTLEGGGRSIGIGLVRMWVELLDASTIRRKNRLITAAEWAASAAAEEGDSVLTIENGIDFTSESYPPFVQSVKGLSEHGFFGRRTLSRRVVIVLNHTIEGDFRLKLRGGAYGFSVGTPLRIKIGNARRCISFYNTLHEPQSASIDITVSAATNTIEIYQAARFDFLSSAADFGFGFMHFHLEPINGLGQSAVQERALIEVTHDSTMLTPQQLTSDASGEDVDSFRKYGIDFSAKGHPSFIRNITGVFDQEHWGCWTAGDEVNITLNHWIEGDVLLELVGGGFGENIGAPVSIKVGAREQTVRFVTNPHMPTVVTAHFAIRKKTNVIKIKVPYPTVPTGGTRLIGLGLVRLDIVVMSSSNTRQSVERRGAMELNEVSQEI